MKVSNSPNNKNEEIANLGRSRRGDKIAKSKIGDAAGAETPASVADSASVSISEDAKALSKAKKIAASDDVDQAKIDRVKAMINNGTYKPDYGKVADKMVNETLLQELA